jgi:hypothetical protein
MDLGGEEEEEGEEVTAAAENGSQQLSYTDCDVDAIIDFLREKEEEDRTLSSDVRLSPVPEDMFENDEAEEKDMVRNETIHFMNRAMNGTFGPWSVSKLKFASYLESVARYLKA